MRAVSLVLVDLHPSTLEKMAALTSDDRGREVIVMSVQAGLDNIHQYYGHGDRRERLLALCAKKNICFSFEDIDIVKDSDGKPINRIESSETQEQVANYLAKKLAKLVAEDRPDVRVYFSYADSGLSFYAGYIMSLIARPQDKMYRIAYCGGNGQCTHKPECMPQIIELPFLRFQWSMRDDLIKNMKGKNFSEKVEMFNRDINQSLDVTIDIKQKKLLVSPAEIALTAKEMAFYLWVLDLGHEGILVDRFFEESNVPTLSFLSHYSRTGTDLRVYKTFNLQPEDYTENRLNNIHPMQREFVQQQCSIINRKLKRVLPSALFERVKVRSEKKDVGRKYFIALSNSTANVSILS